MIESIRVSKDSLEAVQTYVEIARAALNEVNATSTLGRHKLLKAKHELDRAMECLKEAPLTEEELRETK